MEESEMPEGNEIQRRATQVDLTNCNALERTAIEKRYLGATYGEIAHEIGYHETSVRKLFMAGGRLELAYEQYAAIQRGKSEDRVREAHGFLKQKVLIAAEKVAELLESDNDAKVFKAAELIFQVVGLTEETALRSLAKSKTYEQFVRIVGDVCQSEYGRTLQNVTVMPTIKVRDREGNLKDLEFNIGSDPQQQPDPEAQQ